VPSKRQPGDSPQTIKQPMTGYTFVSVLDGINPPPLWPPNLVVCLYKVGESKSLIITVCPLVCYIGDEDKIKTKMALIGKIDVFCEEVENWTQQQERLEQFVVANDIQYDKQRAVLLDVCGAKTYALVRSMLASAKPSDKTFKDICEVLDKHYCPKPSVIVQRYKVNTFVRKQGVSVAS